MRVHHFFDWEGFAFFGKSVLVVALIALAGRLAVTSLASAPSLVLIQQAKTGERAGLSLALSTTTSVHIIHTLAIADAVPTTGHFIAVDPAALVLTLSQDDVAIAKYPIIALAAPGSLAETPAGSYSVLTKEPDRLDERAALDYPWYTAIAPNYAIHGVPLAADGSPLSASMLGGMIRLATEDAKRVYDFATLGTGVFVANAPRPQAGAALVLAPAIAPTVTATSYVIADADSRDIYLEQKSDTVLPAASAASALAALAAVSTVPFDTPIATTPGTFAKTAETFPAGDLVSALLLGNAAAASALDRAANLVGAMNVQAKTLDMPTTRLGDIRGASSTSVTTALDLARLALYLAQEKSALLTTATDSTDIISNTGHLYHLERATTPQTSALSVVPVAGTTHRAAITVLGSKDADTDTEVLADWLARAATTGAACSACALPTYRKVQD